MCTIFKLTDHPCLARDVVYSQAKLSFIGVTLAMIATDTCMKWILVLLLVLSFDAPDLPTPGLYVVCTSESRVS